MRQRLLDRIPEHALRRLMMLRYGELAWQRRLKRVARLLRAPRTVLPPEGYVRVESTRRPIVARVVTSFDAHQARRETAAQLAAALDESGIGYVRLPEPADRSPRFVVSAADRVRVGEALAAAMTGQEWANEEIATSPTGAAPGSTSPYPAAVRVHRRLASASGILLGGADLASEIQFWELVTRADLSRPEGGSYLPGTHLATVRNEHVSYLSPDTWSAAVIAPTHWPSVAAQPSVFDVTMPIDVVYTWVDGADPAWLRRKATYLDGVELELLNHTAIHDARFRSRDELRYSLRSVAMYASWVRRIYLVTDAQVPDWLDTGNPKIQIVDHTEIFSDPSVLPVYNSHAIESQLHHIDGLSEHYLYLNDDVFLGRPVYPAQFFHGNGLAKFFVSARTLDLDPPSRLDLPVLSAAKHNRAFLQSEFGVTVTNRFQHVPHPQLRSVLAELEAKHPELFEQVARSRFRHPDDYSIPSALAHYYAYCRGRAVPGELSYVYQDLARADTERRLQNLLRTRHADAFCLNDTDGGHGGVALDAQHELLLDYLERLFPLPGPFERG